MWIFAEATRKEIMVQASKEKETHEVTPRAHDGLEH
jgi:hypothetical protein